VTTSEQLTAETQRSAATPVGQLTAENRFIEVDADVFAYRRFGDAQAMALPLVMLQHFRGNLDSWDPALTDGLAQDREVIPVDNRGVAGSTGEVPDNVTDMARDALAFIDALGLRRIDLLGFSLGGHVAQELTLLRPRLVRKLVLAGTAPQGGPGLHRWTDEIVEIPNRGHALVIDSGWREVADTALGFVQRFVRPAVDAMAAARRQPAT
jgi:pimeloyl-ACP methyl ester carboxylesterase